MRIGALLALRKVSPPTIAASLSVRSAALRLSEFDQKAAIVLNADGTFCGVVCQASLVAVIAQHGEAALDQLVGDVAVDRDVASCSIHDELAAVLWHLIEEGQSFVGVVRRLRIVDLVFRDELAEWWLRSQNA